MSKFRCSRVPIMGRAQRFALNGINISIPISPLIIEPSFTLDLSHVNAGLKKAKVERVVGVLGADVLWRRNAVIDYDRTLMLLSV